jgi:hypothetical protein
VRKRLVGCTGGATLHEGGFGDQLHARGRRRGVAGEVAVEQLKVVVIRTRSQPTGRGAVIPIAPQDSSSGGRRGGHSHNCEPCHMTHRR